MVGIFPLVLVHTGDEGKGLGNGSTQVFLPVRLQKKWGDWQSYGGGGLPVSVQRAIQAHLVNTCACAQSGMVFHRRFAVDGSGFLIHVAMGFAMSRLHTENLPYCCASNCLEKVDITCVFIQRLTTLPAKAKVASFRAASEGLESWANCMPDSGNEPWDIDIVLEDGCRYVERYDLMRSQKHVSLSHHVRKQLSVAATTTVKNTHSQKYCSPVICLNGAILAESGRILLEKYASDELLFNG